MSFSLGVAGALASLYLFFWAADRTAEDAAAPFLIFAGLFLFLLFMWGTGHDVYEKYSGGRRRRR